MEGQFKSIDYCGDHLIEYSDFVDIIRRCKVSEAAIPPRDLDEIFKQNQNNHKNTINYKQFIDKLAAYEMQNTQDLAGKKLPEKQNSLYACQLKKFRQHQKDEGEEPHFAFQASTSEGFPTLNQVNLQS